MARAYGDLGAVSVAVFQLERAERYLAEGLAYTADRDLDRTRLYMLAWLAAAHLARGRWPEATSTTIDILARPASSSARMTALLTRGRLDARRGTPSPLLDEALVLAGSADEIRMVGPVRAARAEAAWLAGDPAGSRAEAGAAYQGALRTRHHWLAGELAYWRWRAGAADRPPDWIAAPFALHIGGDWRAAADAWRQLGCPYEEARALADGHAAAQVRALAIFDQLGARPAAAELRRAMRRQGISRVPRGPYAATRTNRFGLTRRQLEILRLLAEGLTNAEISGRLAITPKTAEHHVAAVLAKLDVQSRRAAATVARQRGLLGPGDDLPSFRRANP